MLVFPSAALRLEIRSQTPTSSSDLAARPICHSLDNNRLLLSSLARSRDAQNNTPSQTLSLSKLLLDCNHGQGRRCVPPLAALDDAHESLSLTNLFLARSLLVTQRGLYRQGWKGHQGEERLSFPALHFAALGEYGRVSGTDRVTFLFLLLTYEIQEKVKQGQKKAAAEQKEADDWKAGAKVRPSNVLSSRSSASQQVGLLRGAHRGTDVYSVSKLQVKDTSKEDKRQAELARKAELARLLAEVQSLPSSQG